MHWKDTMEFDLYGKEYSNLHDETADRKQWGGARQVTISPALKMSQLISIALAIWFKLMMFIMGTRTTTRRSVCSGVAYKSGEHNQTIIIYSIPL
eukprot:14289579-Heterocapsa_arctica.AAC.1